MDVATREYKDIQIENLRRVDVERYQLDTIDVRLLSYISGVRDNPEKHNLYEILAVLKFFRLMDRYSALLK